MKNTFKRVLALLLAMLIATFPVISSAEEANASGPILMSLFPIEEVDAYINLAEIPLEKLPQITSGELFSYLRYTDTNELVGIETADASVWANFLNEDGAYLQDTWKILNYDESMNIIDLFFVNNYDIEVIIGSGNQLDSQNVRYFIDLQLPIQTSYIDFSKYVYGELLNLDILEIVYNMSNLKFNNAESVEILWYVGNLIANGYEFENEVINGWLKADYDDSIKFAPTLEEHYTCGSWSSSQIMIIKSDTTTAIYGIDVDYPEYLDMFDFSIYTQDSTGERNLVKIDGTYSFPSRTTVDGEYVYFYDMYNEISSTNSYDEVYYLSMNLTRNYSYCDLKVLKGWQYDEDQLRSWIIDDKIPVDVDITKEIVAEDMSQTDAGFKNYWLKNGEMDVTLCISLDNDIFIVPVCIGVYKTSNFVEPDGLFTDIDGQRFSVYDNIYFDYESEQQGNIWYYTEIYTFCLHENFKVDDEYILSMIFYDGDSHTLNPSKVDKAVVGIYRSLEEAENQPDIKEQLFPKDTFEPGTGYKADFSGEGIAFTVFSDENVYNLIVKTEESYYTDIPEEDDEYIEAPQVDSSDSYFRVHDLYSEDNCLDTYIVPYNYDTYYSYGYQTLLINDTEVDMTAVSPEVVLGNQVKVYYGDTMENTNSNYYNKLSPRDFTKVPVDVTRDPYSAVKYTVSTQDHAKQKNYWVTAVKKEEGAKLFVNGPDEREIFLNNYFGNAHDIFIANVGSEELTGLSVSIDATNVKLDDYWTVGGAGNDTLAPFTTTSNNTGNYSGELYNIARIRLIPDGEGEIEGTLTISADGQEPRTISLKGTAGNPKIDTTMLHDAVKYVPYSSIITTNNMHDWNRVTFSLHDGHLPAGLTLYPNGEIYGVPKETGEFPITIRADYSHSEFEPSYADLVLTVKENTDSNINASVDDGYEITKKLPAVISDIKDFDFIIDGEFSEFVDLWLDGDKLTIDIDYTAVEGSTKITLKSKTLSDAGKGKHTISAEFRVGGDKNNELKTASQNFTVGSAPVVSRGSGGGYTTYVVSFETNGGSAVKNQNIRKGNKISDLPAPTKEGYIFAGWFKDAALTQPFDATETINSNIKLVAKWDLITIPEEPANVSIFGDIKADDWYYEDVNWAYTNNIMIGYNNDQFAPSETITNSMVVTVLARLADADITAYENKQIEGVEYGQWFTPYANWAKEIGIAEEISFNGSSEITREMMGVVLLRFLEYMEEELIITEEFIEFADKDLISDKAMNSLQTLYKLGIFKGKENNTIDPSGKTSRAEFAALIHRVCTFMNK